MAEREIRVSVVMPAYNAEKTLAAAIRSVMAQTVGDWELLVIDDSSRDGTRALADSLAREDSRIRVLASPANRGVSGSRNQGVREAVGEFVAFLDSDDLWKPDKLEKQLALAEAHPEASLYYTGSGFVSSDDRPNRYVLRVPERMTYRRLMGQNLISCSSVLARRELLLRYPMENDALHEDYLAWLRILRNEGDAFGIDEPLLIYRISRSSRSGNKWKAALMHFDTYRYLGVPVPAAVWKGAEYVVRSVVKFRAIRSSWE